MTQGTYWVQLSSRAHTPDSCIQATAQINAELNSQGIWRLVSHALCCLQVQGSDRTTIRAVKPKSEEAEAQASANAWPLVAEQSFAREFYHVVLNSGKKCCVRLNRWTCTWMPVHRLRPALHLLQCHTYTYTLLYIYAIIHIQCAYAMVHIRYHTIYAVV